MKTVKMHEAKTHLSRLVQEALAGEEIIIARGDEPLVKLVPLDTGAGRDFGSARGTVRVGSDFDAPVPGFEAYT